MAREENEIGEMKAKIVRRSKLFPKKGVGKECSLVTFDLTYVTFYYNQKLLLYKSEKLGDEHCYEEMVGRLKEGLEVVLEHFYPLSGRFGMDGEGVLRVEKCGRGEEDGGVEFVEAEATGVGVGDVFGEDAYSMAEKLVPFTGVLNLEGFKLPLLAIQLTKLKDGLALGCAFNHAVLDGCSTWHFMTSWSEVCKALTSASASDGYAISLPPFHDRKQARNTTIKLQLPSSNGDMKLPPPPTSPPIAEKSFHFSEKAVEKIKASTNAVHELSNGDGPSAKPLSTFQSLGAHIWSAVTRARRLQPEDHTVFVIFMDCRKRLDPPMPDGYFGNLIQAVFTATASGALLAHPPSYGGALLREAIAAHDSKAIDARAKEWEAAPKLFEFKDAGVNCVTVGSSPRFRVYDVDFGFGKPQMVRSGKNNKFDGMVYLYPGREGGKSVDVEICLGAEAMENLKTDEEFLLGGV